MAKTNLIISVILLIIIIAIKIYIVKKYNNCYRKDLYHKVHQLNIFLYCLSFLIFIITLFINAQNHDLKTIEIISNSLAIAIITMPLSINTLYLTSFKDEEKISHVHTIVTNIYSPKLIKKFNKAGLNVIILSSKKIASKLRTISEQEVNDTYLRKNIIIETTNLDLLNDLNKTTTYFEFTNLEDAYDKIYNARGVADNYIRTIKYNINTYLPLLISYFVFLFTGFPTINNLLLIILLKIATMLISEFVYKKMPYDTDIMIRKPKPTYIFMGRQELFINIMESFCIVFAIAIPYMFTLAQGVSLNFANTLYFISFIYVNIFMTYSLFSEHNIIYNIIKSLKNLKIDLYVIISILITILFNFFTYFTTRNVGLKNYFSSLLFSLIPILIFELTKFARFTTSRKKAKK